MNVIIALAPLFLELLKVIFGSKGSAAEKAEAVKLAEEKLKRAIQEVRAAIDRATDTEGDTSDLEKIINGPKK